MSLFHTYSPDANRQSGDIATRLEELLDLCVERGASDLHISAGYKPYLRQHGDLLPIEEQPVWEAHEIDAMAGILSTTVNTKSLTQTGSLDGAMTSAAGRRFRFNIFRRQGATAVALRRLEDK